MLSFTHFFCYAIQFMNRILFVLNIDVISSILVSFARYLTTPCWCWGKFSVANESDSFCKKQYQNIRVNETCGDRDDFIME